MKKVNPAIFKAYDIRGIYPAEIDEQTVYKVVQAYAKFVNPKQVVLGHDVRLSGPALVQSATQGLIDGGVDVVDVGMCSTDMLYFAVAHYGYDGGLQITASHNPREYNGIKMVRAHAVPISGDSGIFKIRDLVLSGFAHQAQHSGQVTQKSVLTDYIAKVLSVIDIAKIKPIKVVANLNFGYTNTVLVELRKFLPLDLVTINEMPNGEFPKGPPDPLLPDNRTETMALIKQVKPDLGVAWDSDADRCYFFDENGRFLSGYFTTAVLARYILQKHGGGKVIGDPRFIWATQDLVAEAGGTLLLNKAGHSFIKERMIKEQAIFGGENSGHYFFQDFFFLDNGIMPFLLILELLSTTGQQLSQVYQPLFAKYYHTEELNFSVKDGLAVLSVLKQNYPDGKFDGMDGVSIEYPTWRFTARASNTQPLLRLTVEARSQALLEQKTQELLAVINAYQI